MKLATVQALDTANPFEEKLSCIQAEVAYYQTRDERRVTDENPLGNLLTFTLDETNEVIYIENIVDNTLNVVAVEAISNLFFYPGYSLPS